MAWPARARRISGDGHLALPSLTAWSLLTMIRLDHAFRYATQRTRPRAGQGGEPAGIGRPVRSQRRRRVRREDRTSCPAIRAQLSWPPAPSIDSLDRSIWLRQTGLEWWARVDSNYRPHAYQACALTT